MGGRKVGPVTWLGLQSEKQGPRKCLYEQKKHIVDSSTDPILGPKNVFRAAGLKRIVCFLTILSFQQNC